MKAITLWQPWASLVAAGQKRNETRSWGTAYRGRLLIHASLKRISHTARADADTWRAINRPEFVEAMTEALGHADLAQLPYGAILAEANLQSSQMIAAGVIATSSRRAERELIFGDWSPGRFAWHLGDVDRFMTPLVACGHQGLWTPDPELVARVNTEPREQVA